jgi:hypothetical protein
VIRPSFWHGCNYPWSTDGNTVFYGLDFGGNVWGSHLGVSTRRTAVAADFRRMAELGFTIARWFVFCDGRSGIDFDDWGLPAGLDQWCFADLDAGLETALESGIAVVFVLLDHRWMFGGIHDRIADPASGALLDVRLPTGRERVLATAAGRRALLERVIGPMVLRYAPGGVRGDLAGAVFAYELMNEPDFVIEEWEADLSRRVKRPLPFEALADLVSGLSRIVHACSPALTTMSAARLRNLWAWDDPELGLDVLQVHTYPDTRFPGRDTNVFGTRASHLGVRLPVVLGEFPGNGPVRHPRGTSPPDLSLGDYLEFALSAGYAGAWPWSFSGTDGYGGLPEEPLRQFAARYPRLVNERIRLTGERPERDHPQEPPGAD